MGAERNAGGRAVWPVVAEVIRTGRLELLPLDVAHAGEMAVVLDDPALHAFTGGAPEGSEALRARYRRMVAGSPEPGVSWLNWVIRLRDESCLTGTVQATVRVSGGSPSTAPDAGVAAVPGAVAELAWVVGTPWQGRGIATEAARGVVHRLGRQGVGVVFAHIHPRHRASAAVATAVGLAPTGVWQEGEVRWQGVVDGG